MSDREYDDIGQPVPPEIKEELDRVYGENKMFRKAHVTAPPTGNPVVQPRHYSMHPIEPVRYAIENKLNGFQFNINKYMVRAPHKHESPLEDQKKVLRYTEMWIKHDAGDPNWYLDSTLTLPGYYP